MSEKKVQKRPDRVSCVGDLRNRLTIHNRSIQPPVSGSVDATERFAPAVKRWAKVRTVAGKTLFTGVNADVALSHEITIRFDESVGAQSWVELESGTLLSIVNVEDLEERHKFMVLRCNERGDKALGAAQA